MTLIKVVDDNYIEIDHESMEIGMSYKYKYRGQDYYITKVSDGVIELGEYHEEKKCHEKKTKK
jgi:hypothetical protein